MALEILEQGARQLGTGMGIYGGAGKYRQSMAEQRQNKGRAKAGQWRGRKITGVDMIPSSMISCKPQIELHPTGPFELLEEECRNHTG
jgi:hypothetical protein